MVWLPVVVCVSAVAVWALLERPGCVALLVCAACGVGAWQKHSGSPLPEVTTMVRHGTELVEAVATPAPASP